MIHTVSIWLTLSLAIWRFIMIKFPTSAVTFCTLARCKALIICSYVIPIFLTIPNFFSFKIQEVGGVREDGSCTIFYEVEVGNKNVISLL